MKLNKQHQHSQQFRTHIIDKISIIDNNDPFFYLKLHKVSNIYRISLNYEHLNNCYGLKLKFIRDLEKIYNKHNTLFNINLIDDNISRDHKLYNIVLNSLSDDMLSKLNLKYEFISENFETKVQSEDVKYIPNKCFITRLTFKNIKNLDELTTIFLFKRLYDSDVNYSILFCSTTYFNIDSFINSIDRLSVDQGGYNA